MNRHLFWIVELFVWLLILFLIAGGIMLAKYNYKKIFNTYQIFLPDVDGLINGSPVKLMGIQVGYVNQIDIVGEDVYVKFIITDSTVKIPHGSIATVEFSGLGGSKSLELYPPKTKTDYSTGFIITQSPKRIHDSLGLLSDMFDRIADIAYTVSHFMDEMGMIQHNKNETTPYKSVDKVLNFANNQLDKIQKQSDKLNKKLEKIKKGKTNGSNDGKSSN